MKNDNIVEVKNLVKDYKGKIAVNSISFSIRRGTIFGLLGTNGAGKTTTIKILTGQLLPTAGEIYVCGMNPVDNVKKLSKNIGVVTDTLSVYVDETVKRNLTFFGKLYEVSNERVDEVIKIFGLEEYANVKIKKLSKGYKQRVLIARAMLHNPELLFMDEPTSGLDANIAMELRKIINDLKSQGKTILLTTHDMDEAEELCEQVLIISHGEIVVNSSLMDIKNSNEDKFITVVTTNGEQMFKFSEIEKLAKIPANEIISIHSNQYSLKEAFINLTNNK